MKPLWQRQQEQMREQQRRMWKQQNDKRDEQRRALLRWKQQEDKRSEQQQALQNQVVPDTSSRFTKVEQEVARLSQERAAGRLSTEQFEARLHELMLQDADGAWWMLNSQTKDWYRHDGSAWVRDTPSRLSNQVSSGNHTVTSSAAIDQPHRFRGLIIFVIGFAITIVLGLWMGNTVYSMLPSSGIMPLISAIIVWVTGFVMSFRKARAVWRGW